MIKKNIKEYYKYIYRYLGRDTFLIIKLKTTTRLTNNTQNKYINSKRKIKYGEKKKRKTG